MATLKRTFQTDFAKVEFGEDGSFSKATFSEQNILDWTYRYTHLGEYIFNYSVMINALGSTTKENYVKAKKTDLNGIADNLRDLFKMEYKRNLESGFTQELAKKNSMKHVKEFKKRALEQHEKQYPSDMSYENVMRLLTVKHKPAKETEVN